MLNRTRQSLKNINYKMFISLLILGLVPTIYTTVRVFLIGQLPSEYSFSIAGQLSWINLLSEIVNEAIILPLFFFVGKVINDKVQLVNRVKTGLLVTAAVYSVLAIIIICFISPLLKFMAVDKEIVGQSAQYIRIEVIANVFAILVNFGLVVLISIGKEKYLYAFMGLKLVLCILLDVFLVSTLSCSANLGVNVIGFSNIITNLLLLVGVIGILYKENIKVISKGRMSFTWIKDFVKIGGMSGIESFVRNIAYMLMISKMVNIVNEQGTYWVANNFIWGWLLLPITQLGELIKRDVANDKNAIQNNTLGYFALTFIICFIWIISIPLWKPFMSSVLQFNEVDKLFKLVLVLLGFYVLYALQNIFDSTFYGLGKTNYMLFESIVTNSLYYGVAFILYSTGVWVPTLIGIALMFGIGMAFDSIVSLIAYLYLYFFSKNR